MEHQTFLWMRIPASPKKAPAPQHDPCHASAGSLGETPATLDLPFRGTTRPETNISLKNGGRETKFLLGVCLFSGAMYLLVSGRVTYPTVLKKTHSSEPSLGW